MTFLCAQQSTAAAEEATSTTLSMPLLHDHEPSKRQQLAESDNSACIAVTVIAFLMGFCLQLFVYAVSIKAMLLIGPDVMLQSNLYFTIASLSASAVSSIGLVLGSLFLVKCLVKNKQQATNHYPFDDDYSQETLEWERRATLSSVIGACAGWTWTVGNCLGMSAFLQDPSLLFCNLVPVLGVMIWYRVLIAITAPFRRDNNNIAAASSPDLVEEV